MAKKIEPDNLVYSIKEDKKVSEVIYTTLQCEVSGCDELFCVAFSDLDDKGKDKNKTDKEIKKEFWDTLDKKAMPDSEHPEIWYCALHAT